jgi:hypothetical protein
MAEFKLGRIRFVWKDEWQGSTTYYRDDVVSYAGRTYICVIGHTSQADFFNDFDITPPKWNLVADGQTWKGNWIPNTAYNVNDIVKYGSRLYISNTRHTSAATDALGLENDQANWDIYGEGLDWKGEWTTSTRYKVNDLVSYGGITYVCDTYHTSAATVTLGLEDDQDNWTEFNRGIEYKGEWTNLADDGSSNAKYKVNDVVKYGASLWIANQNHTASTSFSVDQNFWDQIVEGTQFEDEWSTTRTYQPGDIVRYGGYQYVAKTTHTGENPFTSTANWDLFAKGFNLRGDWGDDSTNQDYRVGDVVTVGGNTFVAVVDNNAIEPTVTDNWNQSWERLSQGFEYRGEWLDDQEYKEGDIVQYLGNTYACIKSHISEGDDGSSLGGDANSRPDLADSGQYWSIVAVGTDTSVLTTKGDLVYFNGSAPTRLPIGQEGQVLTVNSNQEPEWTFLGSTPDVYYVATDGIDAPAPVRGKTLDKPWVSIRYACQQIEEGARNPNARRLLEINRQFIQREIVEWIDYQVANASVGSIWENFEYAESKCERDMGLIVDALVWDVTHGGNVRSRAAALSYVNDAQAVYTKNQEEQTVAAINYGLTVIENVLDQTAPDVIYQTTNGDNSTAVVTQFTDATITSESVSTEITGLVGIITDAITAGVADNIPSEIEQATLVKVATGQYQEVLPIIVPRLCAVMGDELRAVTASPRTASNGTLTPRKDVKYSFKALAHLEDVVSDVVFGTDVLATTGNTETQSTDWPIGDIAEADAAEQLFRLIRRDIDYRVGDKVEAVYPLPSNRAKNWEYAAVLLRENKEFLKAEVTAYIDRVYPNLKYSRTKCKQDVGYIVDALAYDVTYDGNWQSINAGLAYYAGTTGLQIDSSEKLATLAAYTFLSTVAQKVARSQTVAPTEQDAVTQIQGIGGDASTATKVGDLIDDIKTIIDLGTASAPTTVYPTITQVSAELQAANTLLVADTASIKSQVTSFITTEFPNLTYDSVKCERDVGLIIDAARYDFMLGSNFASMVAAYSYLRSASADVVGDQKTASLAAFEYARTLAREGVGQVLTAQVGVDNTFKWVNDLILDGSTEASNNQIDEPNVYNTLRQLELNKDFLVAETHAYVDYWFKNSVTATNANNDYITISDTSWLVPNMELNFVDLDDSAQSVEDAGLANGTTYYVRDIIDAYNFTVSTTVGGAAVTPDSSSGYFTYDKEKCTRDTGYIVDGVGYDVVLGTNYNAVTNGLAYQRANSSYLQGNQKTQTVAGITRAKTLAAELRAVKTSATALSRSNAAFDEILDIINNGVVSTDTAADTLTFPASAASTTDQQNAVAQLIANRAFLQAEVTQYISDNYGGLVYDSAKCERDVGYLVDALCYDIMYGGNSASVRAAEAYFVGAASQLGAGQAAATAAAFDYLASAAGFVVVETTSDVGTGFPLQVGVSQDTSGTAASATEQTQVATLLQITEDVITAGNTSGLPTIVYPATQGQDQALIDAQVAMEDKKSDIQKNVIRYIDDTYAKLFTVTAAYDYSVALCTRDVNAYIDAIKWDMVYPAEYKRTYTGASLVVPGVYKTKLASRYYANAVLGSQEEDFYYLRNGTGIRLQSLTGLSGDLTPENVYGTSRVTAGAYCSLDPGWGPNDERVWITARSPYIQNVTTFGYAATGQRIDGALHNGGNDSMVSNDFTQVISDGIGAHILNNGRAELVSVFTYYSHIGYLAESGGRIRATNGNNSYGDFGSVAEGFDDTEVPVTAIVDNRLQYSASVSEITTDLNNVLGLEYDHAGNRYTIADIGIFGAGQNAAVEADEFRDRAVNRVRILELNDSSGVLGGDGYLTVENTAQGGSSSTILLSATDSNPDSAYVGMKVVITGGAGAGQYAIIDSYNSGTKQAQVVREDTGTSGWNHFVEGTAIVSPNASSVYKIEPAVSFTAPPSSSTGHTLSASRDWSDVEFGQISSVQTGVTHTGGSGSGAEFEVTTVAGNYTVAIEVAGTGYERLDSLTIAGTVGGGQTPANDITVTVTAVDVNGGIVAIDWDGYAQGGRFVAVASASNTGAWSDDGQTWNGFTLPTTTGTGITQLASGLIYDGSSVYRPSKFVAVTPAASDSQIWHSDDGKSWSVTTKPGGANNTGVPSITFGDNKFYIIFSDEQHIYSSSDGVTWTQTTNALGSTGWTDISYGAGRLVVVKGGSDESQYAATTDLTTWVGTTLPASDGWIKVEWGLNKFVVVSDSSQASAYSVDRGETWTSVTLPSADGSSTNGISDLTYGQGVFIAAPTAIGAPTGPTEYNSLFKSEDGVVWTEVGVAAPGNSTNDGWSTVAFGNPNFVGKFVAVGSGTTNKITDARIGARARGRVGIANEQVFEVRLLEPGSGYTNGAPTMTITDPNNIYDGAFQVRIGDGSLANPSFTNRGTGYVSGSADVNENGSDGYADFFQSGTFIAVRQLSERPTPGSNVVFSSLPDQVFKLVNTISFLGDVDGDYTGFLNISPEMPVSDAPIDGDGVTMRIKYSQVRLTGHDFLDIGTGNEAETNYPGIPTQDPIQDNETKDANGGRVFFTATDQDGNFRVGDLFSVEQSTGIATLNADAFNIAGLQELSLGEVTLGGNSASITEFSTDPFFTANSDTVVPTQRAIKSYIESQIGGGGASLNVNSVTAGDIFVGGSVISSVSGAAININATTEFRGGVTGLPLAINYFIR